MWPPTTTDCPCEQAGWCERHQCFKTAQWHLLCRRSPAMFQRWEEGQGPCVPLPNETPPDADNDTEITLVEKAQLPDEPGLAQKGRNFALALAKFVASGGQKTAEDEYQRRLNICRDCNSCDTERMVCRQPACGCRLHVKARWESQHCPLGKWALPVINDAAAAESTHTEALPLTTQP